MDRLVRLVTSAATIRLCCAILLFLFFAIPALCQAQQSYSIDWSTVDGGGSTAAGTGGSYTVAGTAGQPDAATGTGGTYTLQGGFWNSLSANTPPTISDITDKTINEDISSAAISFTISDAETPVASLTVSGTSSNTSLVSDGSIVFGGSGANRTSDSFVLTVTSVNDAATTVTARSS